MNLLLLIALICSISILIITSSNLPDYDNTQLMTSANMAHFERDETRNTDNDTHNKFTYTSDEASKPARKSMIRDKPVFVGRNERKPFGFGARNTSTSGAIAGNNAAGSSNDVSASAASGPVRRTRTADEIIRDSRLAREKRERAHLAVGLGEAFRRTDVNGEFIPKIPAPPVTVQHQIPSESGSPQSRIPRTRTFSPNTNTNAQGVSPSPPRPASRYNTYTNTERQYRNTGTPAPPESESDFDITRDGSPSPAPVSRPWSSRNRGESADRGSGSGSAPASRPWTGRSRDSEGSGSGSQASSSISAPAGENTNGHSRRLSKDSIEKMLARPPIFVRKNVGERVSATSRLLARKTSTGSFEAAREEVNSQEQETFGPLAKKPSTDNYDDFVEPPLRIPKTWGSRAKSRPGWMQKILTPDPSLEIKMEPPTQYVPEINPDVPLSTIEDVSGNIPTPPTSRPSSALPGNPSPEKGKVWDADIDFTGHSLQISESPQLRVRSSKLDEIRDREIQSLTARAVATNRLEEIRERNSEERSVLSENSRKNEREVTPAAKPAEKEDKKPVEKEEQEVYHERAILQEEGHPIPGTPITVFPAGSYVFRNGTTEPHRMTPEETDHTLRTLAKLLSPKSSPVEITDDEADDGDKDAKSKTKSNTKINAGQTATTKDTGKGEEKRVPKEEKPVGQDIPLPERSAEGAKEKPKEQLLREKSSDSLSGKGKGKAFEIRAPTNDLGLGVTKRYSRTSTPPKSDVDPEERITAEARLFDLQDNRSERNSLRAPSRSPSPSDDGKNDPDQTPRPRADPLSLPTPKVTGAYIETPAPTVRKTRQARSNSSPEVPTINELDVPTVDTKRGQSSSRASTTSTRGSSELRSRSTAPRTATPARPRPQSYQSRQAQPLINSRRPPTAIETRRRLEMEGGYEDSTIDDFEALLEQDAATTDILNTNTDEPLLETMYDEQGRPLLQREVERRIERMMLEKMNKNLRHTSSSIRDARQGIERLEHQVSTTSWPAMEHNEEYLYLKIPIPKLYTYNPPPPTTQQPDTRRRSWKFTWFGLILAIFVAWFFAETAMCEVYCHPTQSTHNNWHPSDPFFPWAIPTKLDHWTGEIVSRSWSALDRKLGPPKRNRGRQTLTAKDWWQGRDGPVGIVRDHASVRALNDDEIVY
ncbi:hypothetical protein B0J14DRAFT_581817 [Halenospora varia]|nr:hypothetical protein B0J14DRAFT_581817 [Halenospora varia]